MTYQNIRFIAYTIDTMPQDDGNGTETYLGVAANPATAPHTVDINARCDLMLRAIQTAAANLPTQSPPVQQGTLLNVFMAPEFFFRGPLGAYSMDEVQLVTQRLQTMVSGAEWTDWLFVFGSILGYSFPTSDTPPYNLDPSKPKEVYNFSLSQQGGTGKTDGTGANAVLKELQAGCDFIASSSNTSKDTLVTGSVTYIDAGASGAGREQQQLAYDGAGIFQQAGITWGLEICLDHFPAVQDKGRLQHSPQLPGEQQIQVQLVPSGGMDIQTEQTMAMVGGYVFNCDGSGGGSAAVKRVGPPNAQGPVLFDVDVFNTVAVDGSAITIAASSPVAAVDIDQLYAQGAGEVVLFEQVAVPAAAKVAGEVLSANWPASAAYQFDFRLVYNPAGEFQAVLCRIRSTRKNFGNRYYFLPLDMQTKDISHRDISFKINRDGPVNVADGSSTSHFDDSLRCQIITREFSSDGVFLAFNTTYSGPDTTFRTCW